MSDGDYKNPKEMTARELLELYSSLTKLSFRNRAEQEYLHIVRLEMLDRMEGKSDVRS